jgi:class 3 adenylate cyclase
MESPKKGQSTASSSADGAGWMSRLGRARHALRNPLTEILGFSEILQDDAMERSLEGLVPGLQSIHQAASVLLSEVNHYLNPDTLGANPEGTNELRATVDRLGEEIVRLAESLSWKCDDLGTSALGDDLLRITGAARTLREMTPATLDELSQPEPEPETPASATRAADEDDTASSVQSGPLGPAVYPPIPAGGKILVVDDNESNRALLARRLRRQGYTVSLAENGRQALEKLKARPFDLLLLDILMPELNGVEVLKRIKTDPATQNVPVIMLSALDEMEAVTECIGLGAEDYLPKPFPTPLLHARVRACLNNKRMSDQLRKYTEWLFGRNLFAQAVAEPESLGLQRQERTVLFADIRGFTAWSEPRPPEEVVQMLNRYFEAAEQVWAHSSVIKTEYTGDEIMGVFPALGEATAVALALQKDLGALLRPLKMDLGVGIHAGPVIEGLVGSVHVKEYCFVGDTVNTANRICSHAEPGEILMSRQAWSLEKDQLETGPPRHIEAKGKTEAIEVLPLLGWKM